MMNNIRDVLKERFSKSSRLKIKRFLNSFLALGSGSNLDRLAKIYGTDKVGIHSYTPIYHQHFKKFKYKRINLLEIGVGGYEDPFDGGGSLRVWKKYFPFGRIFSMDIYDKSPHQERRIKIFKGSQVDSEFLDRVTNEIGPIDIIIDDGSHINEHVIETFKMLFPKLKDGGIYVVEDTQTSYWSDYGGDSMNLNNPATITAFFKNLTDSLNHKEFVIPNYKPNYYDRKITSMHFYHNMIFVYKGNNDEESNVVVNNTRQMTH